MLIFRTGSISAIPRGAITLAFLAVITFSLSCEKHKHHHTTTPSGPVSPGSLHDLELTFENRSGNQVKSNALNKGGPAVLSLLYTSCNSICPIQAANMLRIQNQLDAKQKQRTQFIILSFDDKDTRENLREFGKRMQLGENWTLLRGAPHTVRAFAAALGFQYRRNPDGGFAHSAAIYIIDSRGRVMRRHDGTTPVTPDFVKRLVATK